MAATPVSAGNGSCVTRCRPKACRVMAMLCAMNGCSRTNSFGLTMKLFTYQPTAPHTPRPGAPGPGRGGGRVTTRNPPHKKKKTPGTAHARTAIDSSQPARAPQGESEKKKKKMAPKKRGPTAGPPDAPRQYSAN